MKKKEKKGVSFCSLPVVGEKAGENRSTFYRHRGGMRWQGVKDERYKAEAGGWAQIIRRVLVGARGESTRFHVRYFEVAPGGFSSYECHRHEHVVICVRGSGVVVMGRRRRKMAFMDTAYISPDMPHQLRNPYDEPFGFLCIVNARRDRPRPVLDRGRDKLP